jgi:hypothetical protein
VYVTSVNLTLALRQTVLGMSSSLHVWSAENEKLVLKAAIGNPGADDQIVIDGKDEVVSQRYVR